MVRMHKHAGVVRSDTGVYRAHPVSQQHKDPNVRRAHQREIQKQENTSNYTQRKVSLAGTHKHKGYETNTGALKSHPKSQNHKDPRVQKWHNDDLGIVETTLPKKTLKSEPTTTRDEYKGQMVGIPINSKGYITLDLDSLSSIKGIELSFSRREQGRKRTVSFTIENNPCKLRSGEFLKNKKTTLDISK